jgi:hypothetical protein
LREALRRGLEFLEQQDADLVAAEQPDIVEDNAVKPKVVEHREVRLPLREPEPLVERQVGLARTPSDCRR